MTCKVKRDFKIITDVLSRVSRVTSNNRGSSICSPKYLYKKTSNEILRELKAAFKTMNNIALNYLIEMLENILIELLVLNNNT